MKTSSKVCPLCQERKLKKEFGRRSYCYTCHSEKCKEYAKAKQIWLNEIQLTRGCLHCSYNTCAYAMDFHHINPEVKSFNLGRGRYVSWDRLRKEVEKCVVLCARCHRELHAGLWSLSSLLKSTPSPSSPDAPSGPHQEESPSTLSSPKKSRIKRPRTQWITPHGSMPFSLDWGPEERS